MCKIDGQTNHRIYYQYIGRSLLAAIAETCATVLTFTYYVGGSKNETLTLRKNL